ncbi:MAG: 50S ribosomal protein L18e [Nanoarchaeota archaeon]|nr:50S ribosomal protein L18e [Nanoarchaeota archaeon]
MKSKTKISKQSARKTNPVLVETVISAKKNDKWLEVARMLSRPRRKRIGVNLNDLNKEISDNQIIVIPGKVLSQGDLTKKAKIIAFNFSEKAKDKLLKSGCEISTIIEEIKKNPDAKGIKIIK